MQINNQAITSQVKAHDKPLELKQGEIYKATIKETKPGNEAILQIRGREIQVKFDGEVPQQEKVTVQISGQSDKLVQVKAIQESPKTSSSVSQRETANINQALRNLGAVNPSLELKQAAQIILDKGVPLNRESVQELRAFVEKERGTVEQRLNTVQAVANKRLDITNNHLRAVHEALHGRPLSEVLTNIAKEIDPKFQISNEQVSNQTEGRAVQIDPKVVGKGIESSSSTRSSAVPERPVSEQVRQVREAVQREPNIQRSIEQVRSEVVNKLKINQELAQEVSRVINEAQVLQQSGQQGEAKEVLAQALLQVEKSLNQTQPLTQQTQSTVQVKPTEVLKQMQATVQKEGDFQKATSQLNNQMEKAPFEKETREFLTKSLQEASRLQEQGRELAARQQLMQAFAAVEESVAKLDQARQPEVQQYAMNEAFQIQQLNSKDFIVQTVTEKLVKAQTDFKSLQREITRNLDNIQRLTEAFKSQAAKQVRPLLETTIKKLDNAILKSEMMLLTDMKTEKRLMQASSQLSEAKKLLNKGNYQEANKIVQDVKTLVEKFEFKPSETKVKHFITKEEQNLQNRPPSDQLLKQFDEMSRRSVSQDFSARQAFELVRGLGLNRDSEVAQMLASGKQGDDEPNQNMKSALMQLMKMEEDQGRNSQQTSQALANITGQQLLSKSDANTNLQTMFFSLPLLLEEEVKNLQVFVNSRNEGEKVDWENCNLYFLIETSKLGEVGILVTSTDRNLSLTIKNDQPNFKERIEPLASLCKENLKEVGYNIASINFTKLKAVPKQASDNKQGDNKQEKLTPTFTEKGFDFKI